MSIRAHVDARRLDTRGRFERPARDANGDVAGWSRLGDGDVWAAVDGMKASGAERVVTDGTRSVYGYTVWVRADVIKRLGVKVTDRFVWTWNDDMPLDILDLPDQGLRGRLMACMCEAGVNAG